MPVESERSLITYTTAVMNALDGGRSLLLFKVKLLLLYILQFDLPKDIFDLLFHHKWIKFVRLYDVREFALNIQLVILFYH